jgi:hypothetical protein
MFGSVEGGADAFNDDSSVEMVAEIIPVVKRKRIFVNFRSRALISAN